MCITTEQVPKKSKRGIPMRPRDGFRDFGMGFRYRKVGTSTWTGQDMRYYLVLFSEIELSCSCRSTSFDGA
jgi:hypothetical protein